MKSEITINELVSANIAMRSELIELKEERANIKLELEEARKECDRLQKAVTVQKNQIDKIILRGLGS